MLIPKLIRKMIPGVSWQNRAVGLGLRCLDPVDLLLRVVRGYSHLPPYSVRVRSNGLRRQFGGKNFDHYGQVLRKLLLQHATLVASSQVLEIGCGCGRTAIALATVLDEGKYRGVDIDAVSLNACRNNTMLKAKGFQFDLLDIRNNEYNPKGRFRAEEYIFPYDSDSFDVIFLVSVFTHMPTLDVRNYIKEISRLLRPGGVCMVTAFLMDKGKESNGLSFPFNHDDHYYHNERLPEVAIGYYLDFFRKEFSLRGMAMHDELQWGSWRNDNKIPSVSGFSQDVLFFRKAPLDHGRS